MKSIVSFDGTERCSARYEEPVDERGIRRLLDGPGPLSIRGSGLSYAGASMATGATAVSTRRFDRVIDFDPDASTLRVESGLLIGDLVRFAVANDRWFPVLPGHPHISVGGCVAFNTHGKTQHDIGHFSDHVVALTLVHPDHGVIECGPERETEVFDLTVGGMGLTGWISDVTLRLQPLAGSAIRRDVHRVTDLVDAVTTMDELDEPGTHLYSWNDGNRRGRRFGQGVVYTERFESSDRKPRSRYRHLRPERRGRFVPVPLWNRPTTAIANRGWSALTRVLAGSTMPVADAAFPINGREGYFHLFGRRGFHEYQVIVPRDAWADTVERVRRSIDRHGACVTLTSLKLFAGEPHLLWFRGDGICLTLDGPATSATRTLFEELDVIAGELHAPVNLAKDSRLTATAVATVFGDQYERFRSGLAEFDPERRFDSELRRRIGV